MSILHKVEYFCTSTLLIEFVCQQRVVHVAHYISRLSMSAPGTYTWWIVTHFYKASKPERELIARSNLVLQGEQQHGNPKRLLNDKFTTSVAELLPVHKYDTML